MPDCNVDLYDEVFRPMGEILRVAPQIERPLVVTGTMEFLMTFHIYWEWTNHPN